MTLLRTIRTGRIGRWMGRVGPSLAAAVVAVFAVGSAALAGAAEPSGKTRVLFVGGDWKSQLPNYRGEKPMRGHFVRREVERAAPGKFEFTLWTSYELLQYGEADSLGRFDVIVVGDIMGQSVLPRLVDALTHYVEAGGGLWYCDNHKAFSFNTKQLSFDAVLPIEVRPFRPYDPNMSQPIVGSKRSKKDAPLCVQITAPDHPAVRGLNWAEAPGLRGAHYGQVKAGAQVLARTQSGEPIWVAWDKGKGRALWTGGVFANDEMSSQFAEWPQFGRFYAQTLAWLAAGSRFPRPDLVSAEAEATVRVDLSRALPAVTSKHFGIHGQETASGARAMEGDDLALYRRLELGGTFARTSAFQGVLRAKGGKRFEFLDDGTDLTTFDWSKYDFKKADAVLADLKRIDAEPVFLYWCPWGRMDRPLDPVQYTKYFAASIQHVNGTPGTPRYRPRLKYFEIMNEPALSPAETELPRYAAFFNHAAAALKQRYPGVKFGCGGFYEWSYIQRVMDRCRGNLDWVSRHPYGHTGDAVFYLHDQYVRHARSLGMKDLKFIITEWDFWIYGRPAFDYIMQRWKPLLDRADECIGTLHYRWREYAEGGYVFGVHGEFDKRYGELPPAWPNPGRDKPITYRYNAFWAMRHCRGSQYAATLECPALAKGPSHRAYAVATRDGGRLNVVVYYGYPRVDLAAGKQYETLRLRVQCELPKQVKAGRLVISRANCKETTEAAPQALDGRRLDVQLDLPACSAVSLTVE